MLFISCFFLSLGALSPTSKEIKYEFFAFDEGERILIVSFLPESLSRVLIVMPCDFSVWAPFWTDYVAHKASGLLWDLKSP